jgi:hypothetical protein
MEMPPLISVTDFVAVIPAPWRMVVIYADISPFPLVWEKTPQQMQMKVLQIIPLLVKRSL